MHVNRRLMRQHFLLIRTVRHTHDIDVAKLRPALAPVTMGHDIMPPHLAAGFDLAASRHGPMKQRIVARHLFASLQPLHVFEECGKTTHHSAGIQILSHPKKFFQGDARFFRARYPQILYQFLRLKLSLHRLHNAPFVIGQFHHCHIRHRPQLLRACARLHIFSPHMPHTQGKQLLGWHQPKRFCAHLLFEYLTMFLQRVTLRHFQRSPKLVSRPRRSHVRAARHHVTGKRILLKHVIKRRIQFVLIHLPRHQRALCQIGRQQGLAHAPNHTSFQHCSHALQHHGLIQPCALGHHPKGITLKALQLILADGENLGVDFISNLDGCGGGIHGAVFSQQNRTLANCFLFIAETPHRPHPRIEAPAALTENLPIPARPAPAPPAFPWSPPIRRAGQIP